MFCLCGHRPEHHGSLGGRCELCTCASLMGLAEGQVRAEFPPIDWNAIGRTEDVTTTSWAGNTFLWVRGGWRLHN